MRAGNILFTDRYYSPFREAEDRRRAIAASVPAMALHAVGDVDALTSGQETVRNGGVLSTMKALDDAGQGCEVIGRIVTPRLHRRTGNPVP